MPNSLLTGVSGLISHQRLLDVVGHNIANVNTTGFKSQRILFADLLYETIRPASSSNDGETGGTNPTQVGGGVKVSQTDRKFSQGSLESTGEALDFALTGKGFFTLTDGTTDYYTRAGAFSLDEEGFLVAPGGYHVKRFSSAGEPDGVNPGFQIPGDDRIRVPLGAPVEGVITQSVNITGNLSANAEPPKAQKLTAVNPFVVRATSLPATGATLLNDLATIITPFVAGDTIEISGKDNSGGTVTATLAVDGTTTLQDVTNLLNASFPDTTVYLDDGKLVLEADQTGTSELNLAMRNGTGNAQTGELAFPSHELNIEKGKGPDTVPTIVEVFDTQGGSHELKLTFEKQTDDGWVMKASLDAKEGVVIDGTISNILFSDNGSLLSTGDPTVTIQLAGISAPQTIVFDFGASSSSLRLTHFDSESTLVPSADGSPPGVLSSLTVDRDGEVAGVASNGKVFTLAQLAIAAFRNDKGLVAEADNLYTRSLNSGQPEVGAAGTGGRGEIVGGQLESSNVDLAFEFTRLIVAQRGFSANARTITVSDQILQELTNIIR